MIEIIVINYGKLGHWVILVLFVLLLGLLLSDATCSLTTWGYDQHERALNLICDVHSVYSLAPWLWAKWRTPLSGLEHSDHQQLRLWLWVCGVFAAQTVPAFQIGLVGTAMIQWWSWLINPSCEARHPRLFKYEEGILQIPIGQEVAPFENTSDILGPCYWQKTFPKNH